MSESITESQSQTILENLSLQGSMRNYWAVGCSFGGTADQQHEFVKNRYWSGWDRNYPHVRLGDVFCMKSSSTKGQKHNTTFTRLKQIGIVSQLSHKTEHAENTFSVDWLPANNLPRDFEGISYRETLEPLRDDKMLAFCRNVINANEGSKKMDSIVSLLGASRNLILTGAPGTGKTYLAKHISQKLVFGEGWVLKDEKDFTEEERCLFELQVGFVQFHPSYDYTDFVEGLRPTKSAASVNIGFVRTDGVFKEFCIRALQNPTHDFDMAWNRFIQNCNIAALSLKTPIQNREFTARVNGNSSFSCRSTDAKSEQEQSVTKEDVSNYISRGESNWPSYTSPLAKFFTDRFLRRPFIFIIDEINRGEISKIFGELFYSIDPGYRGEKGRVQTQYANLIDDKDVFKKGFFVPDNVYIIGTMNDIDRSVESLDFAMRRRFVFKEIAAAESAVSMNLPENMKNRMTALNTAISGIDGLNSSYHIGAAYFLKDGKPTDDFTELWNLRLEPLLKEYLRGTPAADGNIDKLRKAAFESSPVA
jgi:hypothetical protein